MKTLKYIKSISLVILSAGILTTSAVCVEKVSANPAPVQTTAQQTVNVITVSPLTVVSNPTAYLNKMVLMKAKFDKFSTLGLDYKPAFKSSDDYISFLIRRDDSNHDIPLSEMKLFLKRDVAEKFIDLKTDEGKVFSNALGDAWVDVSELKIVKKEAETKKDGVK